MTERQLRLNPFRELPADERDPELMMQAIDGLQRDVARMAPVVEAAEAWRDSYGEQLAAANADIAGERVLAEAQYEAGKAAGALWGAVDAYREATCG